MDSAIFDPNLRPDPPEQMWGFLEKIRCPTLIIRGSETDILTSETCEQMVTRIPRSRRMEIPNAGHMVLEDNPEVFNAAVLDFLSTDAR